MAKTPRISIMLAIPQLEELEAIRRRLNDSVFDGVEHFGVGMVIELALHAFALQREQRAVPLFEMVPAEWILERPEQRPILLPPSRRTRGSQVVLVSPRCEDAFQGLRAELEAELHSNGVVCYRKRLSYNVALRIVLHCLGDLNQWGLSNEEIRVWRAALPMRGDSGKTLKGIGMRIDAAQPKGSTKS